LYSVAINHFKFTCPWRAKNLYAAVVLEKIERLDGGQPIERFVVPPDIQERMQAILSRRRPRVGKRGK